MTDAAPPAPATNRPPAPDRNWAGNVRYRAARRHRPATVDEVRRLVAGADRIRAVGSGHSFNRLGDTTGDLVSVAGLPPTVALDRDRGTVTVAAGLRYGDLATVLHADGYAVANLASLPHISVAGAVATATHGSGRANGNLATAVAGLELVTADGDLLTVDRADPRFAGMVVNLGALGVVTRVTLDVTPTFDIRQYVRLDLPRAALDAALDGAYSASVFTDWRSSRLDQVWLKQRVDQPPPPADWLDTTAAGTACHPVPGMPAENCTIQFGAAGPWHERLPHFRLGFVPSSGDELQSEWHVGRENAGAALAALDPAAERIAAVLQICELRTIAADDLWLSPNYERDTVALHFTWIGDPAAVAPVLAEVEQRLAPFAPRPHWGKLFARNPAATYPRYDDFRALLRELDPAGKFRTEELDRYFPRG
ncbi:FAD-binding protein [Micromonospora yasonensis]|uniref:FAD-binding protein n=1 Tax=Micromonospora yasonensis TaxID=1128667 RepID=UPI0022315AF7|nr:FAD-binding protein [Micromonospora yasonensis]MCW3838944.1 FAD-binding protein [Micromonospora yasonensis]